MKRYDLYSHDDQGNFGYANYPIPEEDGQWVNADIAQSLYDALESLMQEWDKHDGHLMSHYHMQTRPKIERAKEALEKADED